MQPPIRLAFLLFITQFSLAQPPEELRSAEAFSTLTDSTMRREIATFSRKGAALWGRDSLLALRMTEIPVKACDEQVVYFTQPKKIAAYVHVYLKPFAAGEHTLTYGNDSLLTLIDGKPYWGTHGTLPHSKVDSVFFVLHSHSFVPFPANAFDGICEPLTCSFQETARRPTGNFQSPGFRLLRSKDTRNTYLYISGGTGGAHYEAIWILQNDRYVRRIVEETDN